MSRSLGKELPDELYGYLEDKNPERENVAIFVVVRDDDDRPHVALLSPYQVVAPNRHRIYAAIHVGSRTENFMDKWKNVTLIFQLMPAVFYIKCRMEKVSEWEDPVDELYSAEIIDVLKDYSATAPFTSDLRFDPKVVRESYEEEFHLISKFASERG